MATPDLLVDATREFLRRHAPFDRMTDDALAFAIPRLTLAYFAQGRDDPVAPRRGRSAHLYIVQRGRVGSRVDDPRADPEPTLGPGECFSVGALSAGGAPTRIYHAVEDTFCYLLPRDDFLELRRRSPEFERFCAQRDHRDAEAVAGPARQRTSASAPRSSRRSAARSASSCAAPPVACTTDTPIADALRRMNDGRVRTIVVHGRGGAPVGMFTLVDLLRRVVLRERPLTDADCRGDDDADRDAAVDATAHEAMGTDGRARRAAGRRRRRHDARRRRQRARPLRADSASRCAR